MWANLDLGTLDFTKIGSQLGEAIQNVKTAAERTVDTALGIDPSATGQPSSTSPDKGTAWVANPPARGIISKEPAFLFQEPKHDAAHEPVVEQQHIRPQRRAPGTVQPVLKPANSRLLNTGREKRPSLSKNATVDNAAPASSSSIQDQQELSHRAAAASSHLNHDAHGVRAALVQHEASSAYHVTPQNLHAAGSDAQGSNGHHNPSTPIQPEASTTNHAHVTKKPVANAKGKPRLGAVRKTVKEGSTAAPKEPDAVQAGQHSTHVTPEHEPTAAAHTQTVPELPAVQQGPAVQEGPAAQEGPAVPEEKERVTTPLKQQSLPTSDTQQPNATPQKQLTATPAATDTSSSPATGTVEHALIPDGKALTTTPQKQQDRTQAASTTGLQETTSVAPSDGQGPELGAEGPSSATGLVSDDAAEGANELGSALSAVTGDEQPSSVTEGEQLGLAQPASTTTDGAQPSVAGSSDQGHESTAQEHGDDLLTLETSAASAGRVDAEGHDEKEATRLHYSAEKSPDSEPTPQLASGPAYREEEENAITLAVEEVIQRCTPGSDVAEGEQAVGGLGEEERRGERSEAGGREVVMAAGTDDVTQKEEDVMHMADGPGLAGPPESSLDQVDSAIEREVGSGMERGMDAGIEREVVSGIEREVLVGGHSASATVVGTAVSDRQDGEEDVVSISPAKGRATRESLAGLDHAQLLQLVEAMREENERLAQQLKQTGQEGMVYSSADSASHMDQSLAIQQLQDANEELVRTVHELQDTNSEHLSIIDDLQAANAAFAASSQEMKKEIAHLRDHVAKLQSDNGEYKEINSELETRLASTERKVYALTKERDVLKKGGSKLADINLLVKEKDEIIKSVMEEGEKLSKKCGDLEEKVRNLRGQLKDSETQIAILNSRVAEEDSKVAGLTKAKAQLEREVALTQQNAKTDLEQLRLSYEEKLRQQSIAQAEAESKAKDAVVEKYQKMAKEAEGRADALADTVVELKEALERQREAAHLREELLQQDLSNLEHRCQVAEARHQELTSKMPDATRPLLRQIEAMQAASAAQLQAWAAAENMLEQRILDAEAAAAAATEREALAQERLQVLQSKLSSSDAALAVARSDIRRLYAELDASSASRDEASKEAEHRLEQLQQRLSEVQAQLQQAELKAQAQLRVEQEARLVVQNDAEVLRKELDEVRARLEAKQREASTSGSAKSSQDAAGKGGGPPAMAAHGYRWVLVKEGEAPPTSVNPTSSSASASALTSSSTSSGAGNSSGGGLLGSDAPSSSRGVSSMEVENLLAELRQKQGDVVFLQHQIEEMKTERTRLSEELVQVAQQCEQALKWQRQVLQLQTEMQALQVKYSAAVEMLGEKDERLEELMADLQDVKQLYRDQIEFMCVQLVSAQSQANTPSSSMGDAATFGALQEGQ